ncbi:MAG TPA: hypothetical protein VIV14_09195, partial [Gammaproteobacteria bacterium]
RSDSTAYTASERRRLRFALPLRIEDQADEPAELRARRQIAGSRQLDPGIQCLVAKRGVLIFAGGSPML